MGRRVALEGAHAVSEAVRQADVDVVAAYPITPQTHIVERISEMVADGEMEAEFVLVESEHTAMSVCVGASAAGARAFTCTAGPGLILMSEVVFVAAGMRLPVVMVLCNRTLSAPLSIWSDHSDAMLIRDCGAVQIFARNAQEAYDHVFHAFRIGEDRRVLLPVIVHMDGFFLTHVVEAVELVDQELVQRYLPPYDPPFRLHPDRPVTMGAFVVPEQYAEVKKSQDEALKASYPVVVEAWRRWEELTGRGYRPVEPYMMDGAETALVAMGSVAETAYIAVEEMRKEGEAVGLVHLRLWRPFPYGELREALKGVKTVVVVDRAISCGAGGPVAAEVRSALHGQGGPKVVDFIVGISGRDTSPEDFRQMVQLAEERGGAAEDYSFYGVKE